MISALCNSIFNESICQYHITNHVDALLQNPYAINTLEYLLYKKNWIDTIQWHLEDLIRDPNINVDLALKIKRRIDTSNQERTDIVEYIDVYFLEKYKNISFDLNATMNTESPAWAIDRLSILALKIYHMQEETNRKDATQSHLDACKKKLDVLLEQKKDLSIAIDVLLKEIEGGKKYMKMYKQMKMYNDPTLNPILYAKHK